MKRSGLTLLPTAARAGFCVFGCFAVLLSPARADDTRYQDYPVGSRAMALGGAFTALSDDPSGLTYNPAGLVDTHKMNVNVSSSLYGLERQGRGGAKLVDKGTFSLATLATLNVIPGEAGTVKGFGSETDDGATYALGVDVTVPSFRDYGTDATAPTVLHTRVFDRTFDAAAGGAVRLDQNWSVGFALHFNLRLFADTEDALVSDGGADPRVGVYHAEATFTNAALSVTGGAKLRLNGWLYGASLSTPGVRVYSSGSVQVQDVRTDPTAPPPHTTVTLLDTTNVESATGIPFVLRLGAARVEPHHWTASAQLTLDLPTAYDRFVLATNVADRLQLQTHVTRHAVLNANLGGEYLVNSTLAVALGAFTDFSTAPDLQANRDGSLASSSSHLEHVSLYGGTASLGFIGQHSITRLGLSMSYGRGEEAVPNDPTGVSDPNGYTLSAVSQLMLYVFLAGTFRY